MIIDHANVSLRSLQVFEAAAKSGSFTAAGEALGITQSGVSRQISDLEGKLGVALFHRNGARIFVTTAGNRLATQLADGFDRIWSAVSEAQKSEHIVTLTMLPSVAARWFAPRLARFMSDHPDIDLRITASRHLVNFPAEGIDAAIRYSRRPHPSLRAVKLGSETVQPVCTPGYAHRLALRRPEDLCRANLLHGDIPENWSAWFAAAEIDQPAPNGPRLGDDGAILQAALNEQGVALGRSLLVADDIKAGRLVAPFSTVLPASYSYWFVRPESDAVSRTIDAVEAWLCSEFAAEDV